MMNIAKEVKTQYFQYFLSFIGSDFNGVEAGGKNML